MFAGILASLTTLELSFSSSIPFVTIALSSSASIIFFLQTFLGIDLKPLMQIVFPSLL